MNKTIVCLIFLSLLVLAFNAGAAGVYKWTDADGVVHFSDQPHDQRNAERVEVSVIRAPRDGGERSPTPPRPGHDEAVDEADEVAQQQAEVRAANCRIARDTLEHNRGIDRMYRLDDNGERVFLTDEERAALLQRSRDDVAQWCDQAS